jgi:hypothetical protein
VLSTCLGRGVVRRRRSATCHLCVCDRDEASMGEVTRYSHRTASWQACRDLFSRVLVRTTGLPAEPKCKSMTVQFESDVCYCGAVPKKGIPFEGNETQGNIIQYYMDLLPFPGSSNCIQRGSKQCSSVVASENLSTILLGSIMPLTYQYSRPRISNAP